MKYRIEVLVQEGAGKAWRPIHPTNGPPYEYDTRQEAEHIKRMCYGLDYDRQARIREVSE